MICDGDPESIKFRQQILDRGLEESDIAGRFITLPSPNDLEDQLLADGHQNLLREILAGTGMSSASSCSLDDLRARLKKRKTTYMANLAPRIAANRALAERMPEPFVRLVQNLRGGTL